LKLVFSLGQVFPAELALIVADVDEKQEREMTKWGK
jgi:hypothetical protein